MRRLALVLCTVCAVNCSLISIAHALFLKDEIIVAVLQYQQKVYGPEFRTRAHVYCVLLYNYKDPSDKIIGRFYNHRPSVKKGSDCIWTDTQVFDAETLEPAVLFFVSTIVKMKGKQFEVRGGFFVNDHYASGDVYYLKRQGRHFVILGSARRWPKPHIKSGRVQSALF